MSASDSDNTTRVLFLTRRFPPSVGGMQTLAADVDQALRAVTRVELIALRSTSTLHLVWFLPIAVLRTVVALVRGNISRVVCGDAIMWATVAAIVKASGAKSTVMVLGLDLSFPNRLYQGWIRWALPKADRIVAISDAVAAAAAEHGIDPGRTVVLRLGVHCDEVSQKERTMARAELARRLDLDLGAAIVVTLGRLVRRKGVAWFVETVMPQLREQVTYLVAGDGPMRDEIEAAALRSGASNSVRLLGAVDDELRELLLRGADICVMPNVRVAGDIEGFGLVAVEAACRGALVLAARLEGIRDAVVDGTTGILVEPEQPAAFVEAIRALAGDREHLAIRAAAFQHEARVLFSADRMADDVPAALGLW